MKRHGSGASWRVLLLSLWPMTVSAHALAPGTSVQLTPFQNQTGDAAFDGALDEALREDLEVSPFLNVAPGERAAGEACQRDDGQVVVRGTIRGQGGGYRLELSASDCGGRTIARTLLQVRGTAGVLEVLRTASVRLRAALGEPASSLERFDIPFQATTSSLPALAAYSTAVRMARSDGGPPAIPLLERAIRLDPGLPQAYALLSTIYGNLRQPRLALRYATRAFRLRGRVGEREKLRIATAYFLATGRLREEMRSYALWQAQYPHDFLPYNDLGNDYAALGRLDEALAEYQKGLELEPTQIGYVNVGGMDLSLDRLGAAQGVFDRALARHLDGRYLRQSIYWLAFLQNDDALMRQQLAWAAHEPADRDALLTEQSDTEAYFGRMRAARELSRQAVSAAVRNGSPETAALWQVNSALREAEVGELGLARQGVTSALALSSGREVTLMAAFTLARCGAGAKANALLSGLEKDYATDALMKIYWLPTLRAALALDENAGSRAIDDLQPVTPFELGGAGTFINYVYPAYVRGQAYLLRRQGRPAAAEFQKLLDHRGVVLNFVTGALAHLEIGRAYALAGDAARSKAAYREFFALWKGADSDLPVLKQAQAEYARLP